MGQQSARPGSATRVRPQQELEPPRMFRVLLHNDHYTTMDFVVEVLESVFGKDTHEAVRIMWNVHQGGIGLCGVYPAQVAETKVATVHKLAQDRGFPLKCSMEPE